ncbi:DUF5668 domain-containing protein [Bacillus sp. 31A1R]|uniref:DUF5668 domain-containing protein n=1 Tax=Robertmurraya mangrovi TaxID=3098077 RepID=A0ABU5J2H0_9BACI|nr:DUF5668 domain-containing protein [Bacillus sp. 31A1R]MDZ5473622.1 DUF5668 domain-containing protein [Bacillus sp. 31A1R]
MRTWRVGTISMGASLLLLGVFLLLSQMFGLNPFHIMMSWWPAILIVLGIEILVFLFLSKDEKPFLKYDFLSIIFVGILGTAGIGFAILSSIGVMDQVKTMLNQEERTFELPEMTEAINKDVKRLVLNTDRYPITIEGTSGNEVSMFGTYRTQSVGKKGLIENTTDYVSTQKKGDTLYVSVKGLPTNVGPFNHYTTMSATILVPSNLKVEVIGNDNAITMKPRTLMSDWSLDQASNVSLILEKESHVNVTVNRVQELVGQQDDWKVTEEKNSVASEEEGYVEHQSGFKKASLKMGKGIHYINIGNAYTVSLNKLN